MRYVTAFAAGILLFCQYSVLAQTAAPPARESARDATTDAPEWRSRLERQFTVENTDEIEVLVQFNVPSPVPGNGRERQTALQDPIERAKQLNIAAAGTLEERLQALGLTVLQRFDYSPFVRVGIRPSDLDTLAALPDVISVWPNASTKAPRAMSYTAAPSSEIAANDIERQQLATTTNTIGARAAWEKGYAGADKVVAILDSGIYEDHEMFQDGIVTEACFSGGGSAQSLCPGGVAQIKSSAHAAGQCTGGSGVCEHGSHVAGIVMGHAAPFTANSRNTSNSHLGVAPLALALPIQVFSRLTSGCDPGETSCLRSSTSNELAALEYLIDVVRNGVLPAPKQLVAVNMSLGGDADYADYCYTHPLATAVGTLRSLGVLTVISSGNDGATGRIGEPACIKQAITVGASNRQDTSIASYSNDNPTVDLIAPGGTSSDPVISAGITSPTAYVGFDGTSMAAPHVAGAIAILRSKKADATADEIEWALKAGSNGPYNITGENHSWQTIALNVNNALDILGQKTRLGIPVAGYYPNAYAGGYSNVRVYNEGSTSGTVRMTLVRDDTGEILGTYSQVLAGRAAVQTQMSTVQNNIGGAAVTVPASTTLTVYFDANFRGYAQNIFWNNIGQSLTNLTSCADDTLDRNKMLGNVHNALFANTYPSAIRVHNKTADPRKATFDIYNAASGAFVGTWTTPENILPGTTKSYLATTVYSTLGMTSDANNLHLNFILRTLGFVIGHVVNNAAAGVLTDMTNKCGI